MMVLPRLYVIADAETLARRGVPLVEFLRALSSAGVTLVQLRDKGVKSSDVGSLEVLRSALPGALILQNDLAVQGYDGVHLGQTDTPIVEARAMMGSDGIIGLSTHTDAEVIAADRTSADYLAIGPVFGTTTKLDAAPVVGLDGVRRARALTTKPLVAIGGITRANCHAVIDAGADSVAVISGLFADGETVEEVARDFLRILG